MAALWGNPLGAGSLTMWIRPRAGRFEFHEFQIVQRRRIIYRDCVEEYGLWQDWELFARCWRLRWRLVQPRLR